jgi:hypothetical protein
MSHKQFSPQSSSHEAKKTRKEQKAALKIEREKFEQEQGVVSNETVVEQVTSVVPTIDEKAQLKNMLIIAVVGTVLLLAIMYWFFAANQ